jgi:hypothetical protein
VQCPNRGAVCGWETRVKVGFGVLTVVLFREIPTFRRYISPIGNKRLAMYVVGKIIPIEEYYLLGYDAV